MVAPRAVEIRALNGAGSKAIGVWGSIFQQDRLFATAT
jgi:hypothetical protein